MVMGHERQHDGGRHPNGLRILFITPSLPYPPIWGFGMRVYQMIRHLAVRHQVTVLTFSPPEEAEHVTALQRTGATVHTVLPSRGSFVDGAAKRRAQLVSLLSPLSYETRSLLSPAMQAALDRLLAEEAFDIVQVESCYLAEYRFPSGTVLLLDEHNIEYELLHGMFRQERSLVRKIYNWTQYRKLRRAEQRRWQRAAGCVLTSAREESVVRRHAPAQPTIVVPNGVDTDYFRPSATVPDPGGIVFTGLIRYRPNADAVLFFVREILPIILRRRPDATLRVVGAGPSEEIKRLAGPHVLITGAVADVRPHVAGAAVMVAPLRMGSGTRLKIVEGLAMGKPIVSTALGCEGLGVRAGQDLLVADEPQAFARAVLRLLDDPPLARSLGASGRALVEREYAWGLAVRRLERFYDQWRPSRQLVCHPIGSASSP